MLSLLWLCVGAAWSEHRTAVGFPVSHFLSFFPILSSILGPVYSFFPQSWLHNFQSHFLPVLSNINTLDLASGFGDSLFKVLDSFPEQFLWVRAGICFWWVFMPHKANYDLGMPLGLSLPSTITGVLFPNKVIL